jgi:hypothetical protein
MPEEYLTGRVPLESVTKAANARKIDRVSRVWFQLSPQVQDARIDDAVAYIPSIPNITHDTFAGQYLALRADKTAQESIFGSAERNCAAAHAYFRSGEVDFDRAEAVRVDGPCPGPPEQCTNASKEFTRAKRFDNVVVRTQIESEDPLRIRGSSREHEDWRFASAPSQFATNGIAVRLGQSQIQQDQIEMPGPSAGYRRVSVTDNLYLISFGAEFSS